MSIHEVGVVGSGTMGSGIAQIILQSGFDVILYDIKDEIVSQSVTNIFKKIEQSVQRGNLAQAVYDEMKHRIRTSTSLADMGNCELVIEAVPENLKLKKEIFHQLNEVCQSETILTSNTSSFSITEIGQMTTRPERVAGLHFFNPAALMPLVEVIKGFRTEEETINRLLEFSVKIGKTPVVCKDTPGFIVNRVARPYYNEALRIMGDRIASVEQIDRIMKKAGKFPMGPFELQDLIGIDINFSTTESIFAGFFEDARFRPHFYQKRMMQSGLLGRKTGRGYYDYGD